MLDDDSVRMANELRTEVEQVAGRVKTRLIRKLLAELNKAPERVMFPNGDAR